MVTQRSARAAGGNRANVMFGSPNCITGAIFRAPVGAAEPDSIDKPFTTPWVSQGAVGNGGLVLPHTKTYATEEGWCGEIIAKKRTSVGVKAKFTLVESCNAEVAKTLFGDQVVASGDRIKLAYRGDDPEPSAWGFDMKDGDKLRRIIFPDAELTTESWDRSFLPNELIKYPVELTLYPDENGVYYYEDAPDGANTGSGGSGGSRGGNTEPPPEEAITDEWPHLNPVETTVPAESANIVEYLSGKGPILNESDVFGPEANPIETADPILVRQYPADER